VYRAHSFAFGALVLTSLTGMLGQVLFGNQLRP